MKQVSFKRGVLYCYRVVIALYGQVQFKSIQALLGDRQSLLVWRREVEGTGAAAADCPAAARLHGAERFAKYPARQADFGAVGAK